MELSWGLSQRKHGEVTQVVFVQPFQDMMLCVTCEVPRQFLVVLVQMCMRMLHPAALIFVSLSVMYNCQQHGPESMVHACA